MIDLVEKATETYKNVMEHPKVSIIVPIYNVEKYLNRCMDSLLNQTLKDIEIIMVDDGSPDRCPQMCDEYAKRDSRIKVIHKKNAGLGYARNSGLEVATGEYVAFVDSDDYVSINMYEKLYQTALADDADCVLSGYYDVITDEKILPHKDCKSILQFKGDASIRVLRRMLGIDPKRREVFECSFSVWHGLYRLSTIKHNGVSFCSERDYISEDLVFHVSFIPYCKSITMIPDLLYYYCKNEGTLTSLYKPGRFDAILKFCHHIDDMVNASPSVLLRQNYQPLSQMLLLSKTLATVSFEVMRNKNNCLSELSCMCDNPDVRKAIAGYPLKLLPKRHQLVFWLMRHRYVHIIRMLFLLLFKLRS